MAVSLSIKDAVNETCPWSDNPIVADLLILYCGKVVGFCNTGCRDKFEKALLDFDAIIDNKTLSKEA